MRKKRFSVEQIVAVLKQVEVGVPVVEVCRQAGITEQTFYRWKKQYVGLEIDQVRQLKQLQEEGNRGQTGRFQHRLAIFPRQNAKRESETTVKFFFTRIGT